MTPGLYQSIRETNWIEGIDREPSEAEVTAHERLLVLFEMRATDLGDFQPVVAPKKPLREKAGMNVRVGKYIAPEGGPTIVRRLQKISRDANSGSKCPWDVHVAFDKLQPYIDGNGRTGRALWVWRMRGQGNDPFGLSFLHRFYYQTLERSSVEIGHENYRLWRPQFPEPGANLSRAR